MKSPEGKDVFPGTIETVKEGDTVIRRGWIEASQSAAPSCPSFKLSLTYHLYYQLNYHLYYRLTTAYYATCHVLPAFPGQPNLNAKRPAQP
jgi:hypothetical protein